MRDLAQQSRLPPLMSLISLRLAGGVLLLAATSKGVATLSSKFTFSLWFVLIAGELLLGLWLMSGWKPDVARKGAILCYALFTIVAIGHAFRGEACRCFGDYQINPWLVVGLDMSITAALVFWDRRPRLRVYLAGCVAVSASIAVANLAFHRFPNPKDRRISAGCIR